VAIILAYSVSVAIFSDAFITPFFNIYKILAIIILFYLFYVFIKAIRCCEIGSVLSLIALVIIVCFSINDILNEYKIIKTAYVIPFGILIFLMIQAIMISKKFAEKENMRLRAEIKALQSQIKPHFLFNSLNTIISVIRVCPEKSVKLLIDLCDFLRYSFNFKFEDEFIDITKEISHINAYLSLEKARFKERLKIDLQIEESINGKVPSFIFQPIVENAVKHGIMVKRTGGNIKISVKNHNKFLLLSVEDDGVGIEKEKINKILENTYAKSGIGLMNVHNRLKNIYGTGLNIDSVIGKGTIVSIKIPT
jgi:two-component system, LytTR family, sensor kinase